MVTTHGSNKYGHHQCLTSLPTPPSPSPAPSYPLPRVSTSQGSHSGVTSYGPFLIRAFGSLGRTGSLGGSQFRASLSITSNQRGLQSKPMSPQYSQMSLSSPSPLSPSSVSGFSQGSYMDGVRFASFLGAHQALGSTVPFEGSGLYLTSNQRGLQRSLTPTTSSQKAPPFLLAPSSSFPSFPFLPSYSLGSSYTRQLQGQPQLRTIPRGPPGPWQHSAIRRIRIIFSV